MTTDLDCLYQDAKSALASRDFDRASRLLRQILAIDENFKDVSRLLAQTVKLRRRRWYNHPLLWGGIGLLAVVAVGLFIAPRLRAFSTTSPTDAITTSSPTVSFTPTITLPPTETPLPAPTAVPLTWKRISLGQEFERDTVTALVIDPKDPEVLYAGMKNAGIFKSIDGGLSWRPAHEGLANAHVTSLLIDFQDSQTLYAGTMEGIYTTENGGETWLRIGEGTHVLMDLQNSSHLYMRDNGNIYESIDHGTNWEPVYSSRQGCPGRIYSWAIHPADGKSLFIAGGEECEWGVYASTNDGQSWAVIPSSKLEIPPGANVLNWGVDKLSIGLDEQGNLDLYPYGIAAYDSKGFIYFYQDAHIRKQKLDGEQAMILGKPDVGPSLTAVTVISVSPFNPDTIYVGSEGLSVSRDGGITWTKLNNGLGTGTIQLNTGLGDMPILYIQPGECGDVDVYSQGHRLGQDNAGQPLYLSTNSGQSWELSLRMGCYLIQDANSSTLYRVGQDWIWSADTTHLLSWLWRSKDQGKSWQTEYIIDADPSITVVTHPSYSGTLYAYSPQTFRHPGSGGEKTFISEDYGNNWQTADKTGNDLKPCYGSTLQFVDAYRPMAIDPFDGNHVFVIDHGTLLESHDSCETTSVFGAAPNTSMNSIAFDSQTPTTLYAGTDDGAYISFDGGLTWNQINDGLLGATVVYSIVVDKDNNVYAATPYGIFKLEGN